MAVFAKLGDYTNGSVADGDEVTTEFNNIYNALNGTSTDKEVHHKFGGSNPATILEQTGAGDIVQFRNAGTIRVRIAADGSIRDANNNELLGFVSVAAAVNYLRLLNAALGNPVEIQAVGDDANIDIQLTPKALGLLRVGGSGVARLTGNNFVGIQLDKTGATPRFVSIVVDGNNLRFIDAGLPGDFFFCNFTNLVTTFGAIPEGPNANPTTGNQLTRKIYVDAADAAVAGAAAAALAAAVPQGIGPGNSPTFANLDVNGQINIGPNNGAIKNITTGIVSVDPPLSNGGDATVYVTVPGVSPGDIVTFIPDPALESTDNRRCEGSYVSDADTVRVTINKFAGVGDNPGARNWTYIWIDLT